MFFYKSGFTLLELVISLAVIAIVTLLATPAFHTIQANQESKSIIYDLKNYIQHSKNTATVFRQDITFCPSLDGQTCHHQNNWQKGILIFQDNNKNKIRDDTEHKVHFIELDLKYGDLTWYGGANRNYILFKGDSGLPRGHIGHFIYCNRINVEYSYKITLNMMGHVKHQSITSC